MVRSLGPQSRLIYPTVCKLNDAAEGLGTGAPHLCGVETLLSRRGQVRPRHEVVNPIFAFRTGGGMKIPGIKLLCPHARRRAARVSALQLR